MTQEYFIKRGDNIRGPFSKQQCRKLHEAGKLRSSDEIGRSRSGDWKSLAEAFAAKAEPENTRDESVSLSRPNESATEQSQPIRPRWLVYGLVGISSLIAIAGLSFQFFSDSKSESLPISISESSSTEGADATAIRDQELNRDADSSGPLPPGREYSNLNEGVGHSASAQSSLMFAENTGTESLTSPAPASQPTSANEEGMPDSGPVGVDSIPVTTTDPDLASAQAILKKLSWPDRPDLVDALGEAAGRLRKNVDGLIVVGQLELEAGGSLTDVVGQCEVLEGGYFVDSVLTPGIPLSFWHKDYEVLSVIPTETQGVNSFGQLVMKKTDALRGNVRGKVFRTKYHKPSEMTITATYRSPWLNKIISTTNQREALQGALEAELAAMAPPDVEYDPHTGEFSLTGLADVETRIVMQAPDGVETQRVLQVSSGQNFDLGVILLPDLITRSGEALPEIATLAASNNGRPLVDANFQRQRQAAVQDLERGQAALQDLEKRTEHYKSRLAEVEKHLEKFGERSAVLLFAELFIQQSNGTESYMLLNKLVKPGVPIEICLHGYMPLKFTPKGSMDGVEVLEALRLTLLQKRAAASISGKVSIEGGNLGSIAVRLVSQLEAMTVISPEGHEQKGLMSFNDEIEIPGSFKKSGEFSFGPLSPMPYKLHVSAGNGHTEFSQIVHLNEKEKRSLPEIRLYPKERLSVDHLLIEQPKDQLADTQSVAVQTSTIVSWQKAIPLGEKLASLPMIQSGNTFFLLFPDGIRGSRYLGEKGRSWGVYDLGDQGIEEGQIINSSILGHATLKPSVERDHKITNLGYFSYAVSGSLPGDPNLDPTLNGWVNYPGFGPSARTEENYRNSSGFGNSLVHIRRGRTYLLTQVENQKKQYVVFLTVK